MNIEGIEIIKCMNCGFMGCDDGEFYFNDGWVAFCTKECEEEYGKYMNECVCGIQCEKEESPVETTEGKVTFISPDGSQYEKKEAPVETTEETVTLVFPDGSQAEFEAEIERRDDEITMRPKGPWPNCLVGWAVHAREEDIK